jgi:subtilisin-like proprotein convertase family protein
MTPRLLASGRTLLALLALAALASPASALNRNSVSPVRLQKGPAPEATVTQGKMEIGVQSGVPRTLFQVGYPVKAADPEAMARQYLRENAGVLRLSNANLSDLATRATRPTPAGVVVRFEQRVKGVPVLASDIAVTIDKSNRVTYVANGYEPGVDVASVTPTVLASAARAVALDRIGVRGPISWESSRLVVVPEGKTSRLAWEIRIEPNNAPNGDWQVLVDANSGDVFRVEDLALDLNGTGFVFDPDPLSSGHATYNDPGYTDGNDVTTPQLDAQRASRTLLDITDIGGGTIKLQGPWAEVTDFEAPNKGLFTQVGTTFNFDRAADNFEAVLCYFHIDQQMRWLNTTLGLPVHPYQYPGGVKYDPSGFNGADNSHYLSGSGSLSFGEGGVDDAEDADVVLHELGHGIHDWVTSGSLSQVNGLSEGLGDYVCQSYSRSLGQWASNEAPYNWTFSWDGHNPFWPGRVTNYPNLYPGGLTGEVHDDGQIIATCLMRIYNQVGRIKTDKAVWVGIASTNSSTNQNQAAQAILQAAISLGYTNSEISIFANEMQATGYSVSLGIDYVSNTVTDICYTPPSNVNAVLEPGERGQIRVSIRSSAINHTNVTGTLTSPTPGVTIIDGTATWPNLSPNVTTGSDSPDFTVELSQSVACLSSVQFNLSVSSDQGGPFPMSFSVPVGSSLTPGGLPASIPDNAPAGVTSTLNVPTSAILTDVNVRVAITHTWVGDLFIKIRSPLGTEVTLLDRPGVPASTFGCSSDNMNVTFDDEAAQILESYCPASNPWYAGPAQAVGLLSAFDGQNAQGNWVLTVSDNAGSDVGSVTSWELLTTPPLSGTCNACVSAVDVPVVVGGGGLELYQNFPNPFGKTKTAIQYRLARTARTTLNVYDITGKLITTLVDREQEAGPQIATWNGTDLSGKAAPSGIYFYRLTSGGHTAMKRMLLVH